MNAALSVDRFCRTYQPTQTRNFPKVIQNAKYDAYKSFFERFLKRNMHAIKKSNKSVHE